MFSVIQNYCDNESYGNGLFLIDMPTGFGKTYAVLDYIYTASMRSDRKIFFITTLKKNLPKDELRERFKRDKKLKQFQEKFLFIDSNADCVIENLTAELICSIPEDIKKTDEYKAMEQDIKFIHHHENNPDTNLKSIVTHMKENLRIQTEPAFRRYVSKLLASNFNNVEKRLYALRTDNDWKWLGQMYPAVFTRNKQIIFMSIDKFLSRNSTIVEPSYMFYNSDIIQDAIIFIDEFDATKDTLLKNIIQNGLQSRTDYLELFKDVYTALQTKEFPSALTTPSQRRQASIYNSKPLEAIISDFKDKAEVIYHNYSLQFSYKTSDDITENNHNFLFQDHQFHSILNNKNYVVTEHDESAKLNRIKFVKEKPAQDSKNIFVMLGKLRGFISFFQRGVNILASNYMECKQEHRQPSEDEFSREAAVRTVLSEFRLNKRYIDYLTSAILMSSKQKNNVLNIQDYDLSFYEKGFRYFEFENDASHDMQSQIMMCTFQNTPEKIMLRFCEKAKVIGISATATINSVIGNYDINYLKSKLQNAFYTMSAVEKSSLAQQFEQSSKGYSGVRICTTFLNGRGGDTYSVESWKTVYDDAELALWAYNMLELCLTSSNNKTYAKERYVRIAQAYREFVIHQDIQSFLCLLTKHPRKGDYDLDMDVLIQLFDYIAKEHNNVLPPEFNAKEQIEQLDGEEYDAKKDNIIKRLERGEKLFVISVYQTVGAGQNIQYRVPHGMQETLVKINGSSRSRAEKDFDAIYLDKPTNMIVNLDNGLAEDDFVKYLFQMEFLQQNAELATADVLKLVKNAFRCYSTQNKYNLDYSVSPHATKSVSLLETRTIVQAVGRICRTNLKRTNIFIYADSRLRDEMDVSIADDRLLNPEFRALLDQVCTYQTTVRNGSTLEHAASLTSVRVNTFIKNLIREDWTEARIDQWKALRDMVLSQPTMSKQQVEADFIAKNFYVELPKKAKSLFYNQIQDYTEIKLAFDPSHLFPQEVSEQTARLAQLLGIPGVRKLFQTRGWATEFAANDYITSPALFNNIYKGALGEVIGKFLFSQYLDIDLQEINDINLFELFDFKVNDRIYVDFKHWQEATQFDATEMRRKIDRKLSTCGGKCALIVNIIADDNAMQYQSHRSGREQVIIEIPYLCHAADGRVSKAAIEEIRRCIHEFSN